MNPNILKVDLDSETKQQAIDILVEKLSYIHDIGIFPVEWIDKIVLGKKSSYNAKILLKSKFSPEFIIIFQLILGSDYRKEANTILNHFHLEMKYSNRLFDIKVYPNGSIKRIKAYDVTKAIKNKVLNKKRKKFRI